MDTRGRPTRAAAAAGFLFPFLLATLVTSYYMTLECPARAPSSFTPLCKSVDCGRKEGGALDILLLLLHYLRLIVVRRCEETALELTLKEKVHSTAVGEMLLLCLADSGRL
jgi:hypothetical protein